MNDPKKSRKLLLLVGIAAVVALVATGAVVAISMAGSNSVSKALNVIPSFKDIGKTESGTVDKYNYNPFAGSPTSSTEALTLLRIIDPAQGVNNTDIPSPGTRFVVVEFKVADTGSLPIPILGDVFNPVSMIGSDGQTYTTSIMASSKTTLNCPAFNDSSEAQIAPGQSVTGCLRFNNVPTSVKIIKFTYTFRSSGSQRLFTTPTPAIQTTAVWSSQ